MKTSRVVFAAIVALAFAGCESGPAGPGTLTVEVTAPVQLGAVVMRVTGPGITAVNGLGGSEVASRQVSDGQQDDHYRVVAFAPNGGTIRIGVDVESTDAALDAVALDAAGFDGVRTGVAGVDVRVVR